MRLSRSDAPDAPDAPPGADGSGSSLAVRFRGGVLGQSSAHRLRHIRRYFDGALSVRPSPARWSASGRGHHSCLRRSFTHAAADILAPVGCQLRAARRRQPPSSAATAQSLPRQRLSVRAAPSLPSMPAQGVYWLCFGPAGQDTSSMYQEGVDTRGQSLMIFFAAGLPPWPADPSLISPCNQLGLTRPQTSRLSLLP